MLFVVAYDVFVITLTAWNWLPACVWEKRLWWL